MADSAKPYRAIFLFVAGITAVVWLLPLNGSDVLGLRLALSGLTLVVGLFWLGNWDGWTKRRAPEAPDLLAQHVGAYFERNGLCFAPRLHVENGMCWFRIYCQNRFSNGCVATIGCIPMEGMSKKGPHDVEPVILDVALEGGEVALVSVPYPIAAKWQGRVMIYDIVARTRYPGGNGNPLRSGRGLPVDEPKSNLENTVEAIALLAMGTIRISTGASVELTLPCNVDSTLSGDRAMKTETLWTVGEEDRIKKEDTGR